MLYIIFDVLLLCLTCLYDDECPTRKSPNMVSANVFSVAPRLPAPVWYVSVEMQVHNILQALLHRVG